MVVFVDRVITDSLHSSDAVLTPGLNDTVNGRVSERTTLNRILDKDKFLSNFHLFIKSK